MGSQAAPLEDEKGNADPALQDTNAMTVQPISSMRRQFEPYLRTYTGARLSDEEMDDRTRLVFRTSEALDEKEQQQQKKLADDIKKTNSSAHSETSTDATASTSTVKGKGKGKAAVLPPEPDASDDHDASKQDTTKIGGSDAGPSDKKTKHRKPMAKRVQSVKSKPRLSAQTAQSIINAEAMSADEPSAKRYDFEQNESQLCGYLDLKNTRTARQSYITPYFVEAMHCFQQLGSPSKKYIKDAMAKALNQESQWKEEDPPLTVEEFLGQNPVELFREGKPNAGAPTLDDLDNGGKWIATETTKANVSLVFGYMMWWVPFAAKQFDALTKEEQRKEYEKLPQRYPRRLFPAYKDLQLDGKFPVAAWNHPNDRTQMCEGYNRVVKALATLPSLIRRKVKPEHYGNGWKVFWDEFKDTFAELDFQSWQPGWMRVTVVEDPISVKEPRKIIVRFSTIDEYGPQPDKWYIEEDEFDSFMKTFTDRGIAHLPDRELPTDLDPRNEPFNAPWRDKVRVWLSELRTECKAIIAGMSVEALDGGQKPQRIYDRIDSDAIPWQEAQDFIGEKGRTTILKIQVMFPD